MTTASLRQPTPEPCAWCDRPAVAFYVQKTNHAIEIGFCRTCDPLYEPDACAEHPAGCPPPRAA